MKRNQGVHRQTVLYNIVLSIGVRFKMFSLNFARSLSLFPQWGNQEGGLSDPVVPGPTKGNWTGVFRFLVKST